LETVEDKKTGIFFEEQTVDSLNKAINKFETMTFDPEKIRAHSKKFDKINFKKEILEFIQKKL
jgi:UDP-N-acetylglucosamine:LPS N-acetylglucosamine transferase